MPPFAKSNFGVIKDDNWGTGTVDIAKHPSNQIWPGSYIYIYTTHVYIRSKRLREREITVYFQEF